MDAINHEEIKKILNQKGNGYEYSEVEIEMVYQTIQNLAEMIIINSKTDNDD